MLRWGNGATAMKTIVSADYNHLKRINLRSLSLIRFALIGAIACLFTVTTRLPAQTNNGTTVQISGAGTSVNLNWNSGGTLQSAPSLGGPWTSITTGVSVLSSLTSPVSGKSKFFRVVNNGI